ncbi:MAG: 50S ribosomal protein L25 [Candidatus Pacebacteria bacterium]|nr:50S ribosomal protein L25 [Candidatus Paceibacterota bacterium]
MSLKANIREKGQKIDKKFIPAVIYGPSTDNQLITLAKSEFEKAYEKAGESSLIDLKVNDQDVFKVLVKEVQVHPTKSLIRHVDLYQVDMKKKITTEIPLHFIGASKAEKEQGALVMKNLDYVEVECLPGDLVDNIEVNLEELKEIGEAIHVKDLKVPQGMEILHEDDEVVVSAIEPKQEEEPAPSTEEVGGATEETKEGKKDEQAETEGEEKKEDK